MDAKIDFNSHLPYYIQLLDILREKVQTGTWAPGDQIPGEQELCELFSVSRTVVRQALRELELDGVITRRKAFPGLLQGNLRDKIVRMFLRKADIHSCSLVPA